MKSCLNRTAIFKFNVHGIELHAAFDEREKQKFAKFEFKNLELSFFSYKIALVMQYLELSFFSYKIALVMQFCGIRKITLNYAMCL